MRKLFFILSILFIYLPVNGQKASYYYDKSVDLNKYTSFYLVNSPIDAHDIGSAYFNKNILNDNEYIYFSTYYELSLKNISVIDGEQALSCFLVKPYMSDKFDNVASPLGYKPAKLKGITLIIDLLDATTQTLVWRGWISLAKIKAKDIRGKINAAIHLIAKQLQFEGSEITG